MFDDLLEESSKKKIGLKLRFIWFWRRIDDWFYDTKYAIRNYFKWRRTIRKLRPWEGHSGLISVMQAHLKDYIEIEEKYGHAEENYKNYKIATAKETLEILKRMQESDNYSDKRIDDVKSRYPDYKSLNTKYLNGGGSSSGDFVAQGSGWAGKESGSNPRKGYFEFIDRKFELTDSPDQNETNRILAEIDSYYKDFRNACEQANLDFEKDVERLSELLKENLYTWWD
jgi:hypothetical protein